MAIVVRMPEIATGSAEAAIASWLVAVGDDVSEGQEIVEIETEKATVEYSAEQSGVVAGILLDAGSSATVGTPIVVLATGGQSADDALAEAGVGSEAAAAPEAPSPPESAQEESAPVPSDEAPAPSTPPMNEPDAGLALTVPEAPGGERLFASPLVRKLARERGIDLTRIHGTGPNGRIVRRDIDGSQAAPATAAATVETPAASTTRTETRDEPTRSPDAATDYIDVPHTGMRRAIARRLTESKSTVPHFYLVAECRMDDLLALRKQINSIEGIQISVNDFIVKAVAGALRDVPDANAIWTDDATRRFTGIDISVAVSIPGGLLTPVVRGVEKLSLGQLGETIRDLATRAREGRLKQHELEGGSFSVSNLGMYGTSEFSAILNPPQAGILAVGAAEPRPVVQEDGSLGIATVMTVTLSADHRVLDGALAAEWLAAFTKRIEHPMSILV
ncbi:pyruvate dehydrogenase complex dihydrolipoamide acetyltransferase [Leucobacter sp. USCH14]|uniref:pyruvate dehydrogenase complex dihydrolipoamide acetyltransferase n=1 Tax=Leucobacter sp. USCH14 TaxID=3024838 RepID=UPI00309EDC15